MPHKLTLSNEDDSYSQTLSLASDAQACDTEGTSVVTFKDMTEHHVYTLRCDDGSGAPYVVFESVGYDQIIHRLGGSSDSTPPPSSSSSAGAEEGPGSG